MVYIYLHLRSTVAAWVTALDDAAVGIHHLIIPHLHTILETVGNVKIRARAGHPCQILAGVLEGICVVAAIVLHGALQHIQLGQVGKLIVPLHGGHAAGLVVVGIIASGDVITLLVVGVDQQRFVLVGNLDQACILTIAGPLMVVTARNVIASATDTGGTIIRGTDHSKREQRADS